MSCRRRVHDDQLAIRARGVEQTDDVEDGSQLVEAGRGKNRAGPARPGGRARCRIADPAVAVSNIAAIAFEQRSRSEVRARAESR